MQIKINHKWDHTKKRRKEQNINYLKCVKVGHNNSIFSTERLEKIDKDAFVTLFIWLYVKWEHRANNTTKIIFVFHPRDNDIVAGVYMKCLVFIMMIALLSLYLWFIPHKCIQFGSELVNKENWAHLSGCVRVSKYLFRFQSYLVWFTRWKRITDSTKPFVLLQTATLC